MKKWIKMQLNLRNILLVASILIAGIWAYQTKMPVTKEEPVVILDPAKVVLVRTPGGMLEVATLIRTEEFSWSVSYKCWFINCPNIFSPKISKVRVPVHYVYRVPLSEQWELVPRGDYYELTVPGLEPSRPVGIESSKLEIETKGGWVAPADSYSQEATMKQLGPELDKRAGQETYLQLAQTTAAKTIEEFARKWISEQKAIFNMPIRVRFKTSL